MINNNKNKGVFHTRYLGTQFSKGLYIYFLDPDDFVLDVLEEAYEVGVEKQLDIVEFLYYTYLNGDYTIMFENFGKTYIRKNEEVKYYMFFNSSEDRDYTFSEELKNI